MREQDKAKKRQMPSSTKLQKHPQIPQIMLNSYDNTDTHFLAKSPHPTHRLQYLTLVDEAFLQIPFPNPPLS